MSANLRYAGQLLAARGDLSDLQNVPAVAQGRRAIICPDDCYACPSGSGC